MNTVTLWNSFLICVIFPDFIATISTEEIVKGNDYLTDLFGKMLSKKTILKLNSKKSEQTKFVQNEIFVDAWHYYKKLNNKKYSNKKIEEIRKRIFFYNVKTVVEHNEKNNKTFTMGINQFADMTEEEIDRNCLCYKSLTKVGGILPDDLTEKHGRSHYYILPDSIDLRDHGYYTPVRDQKACGACYAFSSISMLEAYVANRTNTKVMLSPQQIIDCSHDHLNCGCQGGYVLNSFNYVKENGLVTESEYPFKQFGERCTVQNSRPLELDMIKAIFLRPDEYIIKRAVVKYGPIGSGINARTLMKYKDGILSNVNCGTTPTHAITIMGYGVSSEGEEYWLIKNSWGLIWGDQGYAKVARNKNNLCAIGMYAIAYKIGD